MLLNIKTFLKKKTSYKSVTADTYGWGRRGKVRGRKES